MLRSRTSNAAYLIHRIDDLNKHCLSEFRFHWKCLDNNNHQLWQCRRPERLLNKCVFEKIGLEKVIPDTPKGETPVHLKDKQIFADRPHVLRPWEAEVGLSRSEAKQRAAAAAQ